MQQFQARIRYAGAIAAFLKKRDWNRGVEEPSWQAPGVLWRRQFRPKHFTRAGAKEYQYAKRKGEDASTGSRDFWRSYMGRKQRLKRHQRPLVWSGEMEQETRRAVVRSTSKGMKIVMNVRKANWRHPNSNVNMAQELRTVSAREAREMVREKERAMIREIRQVRAVFTQTIR